MNSKEYIKEAIRTDVNNYHEVAERLNKSLEMSDKHFMLLHATMGLCTEVGEFTDAMKKFLFYGKPLDYPNLREELGDIEWYMALAHAALETTHEDTWRINIEKLKARYPEKFNEFLALNRNLEKERKILEGDWNYE